MRGRVLVVDDQKTNLMIIARKLCKSYFDVQTATSGLQAIEFAKTHCPDVILIDVMMPEMDGFEACSILKNDPETAHIPVVILTSLNQIDQKIKGLQSGADDFLVKPISNLFLFSRVHNLIKLKRLTDELRVQGKDASSASISVFLNSLSQTQQLNRNLSIYTYSDDTYNKLQATISDSFNIIEPKPYISSDDTYTWAKNDVSLFIIDQHLPNNKDGLRFLANLKSNQYTMHSAIISIIDDGDEQTAATALDIGASDFVFRSFDPNELYARIRTQLRHKAYRDRSSSNLRVGLKLAIIDPLTSVYNRRYASHQLNQQIEIFKRTNRPFSVMIIDIDHFKKVNDTYGHDAGDMVLVELSQRIKTHTRGIDVVARLGGEEFLIIMPETTLKDAHDTANRLREIIYTTPFSIGKTGTEIPISISAGLAEYKIYNTNADNILSHADEALYHSKRTGRNCVTSHPIARHSLSDAVF